MTRAVTKSQWYERNVVWNFQWNVPKDITRKSMSTNKKWKVHSREFTSEDIVFVNYVLWRIGHSFVTSHVKNEAENHNAALLKMFPCISIVFDPVISTLAFWRNSVSLNAPYLIFSVPLRSDVQGALQNMLTRWYSLARNPHLSGHRLWERSSLFTWSFL